MTKVEVTVSFRGKGDEVQRLERKNNKSRLARTIVDIHHLVFSELTPEQKLEQIGQLTGRAYW